MTAVIDKGTAKEVDFYMINAGLDLRGSRFLGEGRNGKVFLLPDGKTVKICMTEKSCQREYEILQRVNGNKYFPKVYECIGTYMVRDYVPGRTLKSHIKEHGLSRQLIKNIIELLEEFKKLNFTRIDTRCKDIFVQKDLSVKIIDPKNYYSRKVDYPKHLLKGLAKLGVSGWFKRVLCEERPDLYQDWVVKYGLVDAEFGY